MGKKKALLIIDMLKDFVDEGAPLEVPATRKIIGNIVRVREKAKRDNIPVIYLCDNHSEDDPEFKVWPKHAVRGTEGSQIIDELRPEPGDIVIPKTTYSGFYQTDLDKRLKSLGIEELILTGCVTNICVLYTAVDAYMRGYYVDVPDDCVAAIDEEDHRFALRQIRDVLKPRR